MGKPRVPLVAHDSVVCMDYGQFILRGGQEGQDTDLVRLLERALGAGIAADRDVVLVLSPHQYNFAMPLRIEVLGEEPPDDLSTWQEVFEVALDVGEYGELSFESPTVQAQSWEIPPGRYTARIAGRGFVNRGWPGSTEPGDSWRIQLWPRTADFEPRRVREWLLPPL